MSRSAIHPPTMADTATAVSGFPAGLDRASLTALAQQHRWRLVVLFGSVARAGRGRDLDLAVLPAGVPDLLEQGRWQAELEALAAPRPVDLLLMQPSLSPVTRFEVFRAGVCLFEAEPGLFERERDRAFFLHADSEWFRHQQREVLYGTEHD
jgi:predicted nucleotidyltransferase